MKRVHSVREANRCGSLVESLSEVPCNGNVPGIMYMCRMTKERKQTDPRRTSVDLIKLKVKQNAFVSEDYLAIASMEDAVWRWSGRG